MTLKEQYVQDYINRYYQTKKYVARWDSNCFGYWAEWPDKFELVLPEIIKYIKKENTYKETYAHIRRMSDEIDTAIKDKIKEYVKSNKKYTYDILYDYEEMEMLRHAKTFFLHLLGLVIDVAIEREEPPLEN